MIKNYRVSINGGYIFLGIFYIIYQILGSIFTYTPLLYGLFFCYMIYLLEQRQKTFNKLDFRWYFSLFFLFFTDITYDFFIFSSWIAFALFYYICADWIKTSLKIEKFIPIAFVLCAYFFIFLLDFIFSYMNNQHFKALSFGYLISIGIECFLAYVFFRGKI
ncbi:hypothetical protein H2258_05525 [Campylobacter sp. RM9939]|uniref:hypothetical protein n=1 Tax=Campylobacter molothri TaxID=1032242 RepID=UPI001D220A39|nr:hypothetical protein [Campylobacter sp. RM10537]MBZ7946867.1 hypothetical protein [Campylobacter sp. RM10536]MBZ7952809.1 hypothetical protein [Campylobacter sp. RM9939]MBZ7957241.1 hypothetical protein [Campylobacter sp. RM10541]ULN99591.1 putative membrane protein [Campylobacter sp. RM10537]